MTDTPKHIQELQLKLWLAKTPAERFMQFLVDNEAMHNAIIAAKTKMEAVKNSSLKKDQAK